MNKPLRIFIVLVIILLIGSGFVWWRHKSTPNQTGDLPQAEPYQAPKSDTEKSSSADAATDLPDKVLLSVPFTPQAPSANWDELHNEACEEASAVMAEAYFSGDTRETLPAAEVEKKLQKLFDWETDHLGSPLDATAKETATMIQDVYGLSATVKENYTEGDLQAALAQKKLIILPLAGQKLGNPYFKSPGPIYHMIILRGYTGDTFVTNDPGTKHGENYRYSFATLHGAGADWNHDTNSIDANKPLAIIVSGK